MKNLNTSTPLTKAESDFATENYYLIDEFLRVKGYSDDEFFDVVVFGFLRAVRRYVVREDLQKRYKFKTIAFRCMQDDISNYYKYQNRAKRTANLCIYNEDIHTSYLSDSVWENYIGQYDSEIIKTRLTEILTPKQRSVAHLKGNGYSYKEIAEQSGLTSCGVRREVKAIEETIKTRAAELHDLVAA